MYRKLKITAIRMVVKANLKTMIEERIRPLLLRHWDDIESVNITIENVVGSLGEYYYRINVELSDGASVASEIRSINLNAAIRSVSENVRFATTDMIRSQDSSSA